MLHALTNLAVLDGSGAGPVPGRAVLLDGPQIAAVVRDGELPSDVEAIDLGGATVMPGLIDCHVHFALWALEPLAHAQESVADLSARTYAALANTRRAGWTAARDPGGLGVEFRDAVRDGLQPGPRLQTSLTIVSPANGIVEGTTPEGEPLRFPRGIPSPICSGPIEARAKVQEVVEAGADFVKIGATGGVASPRREPRQRLFSDGELRAIVDEAHALGRPVICHALGGPGLLAAVRAGVDTIEHGVWLEDEAIDEMRRRGTWYVPTLAAYELHARQGAPLQRSRAEEIVPAHRQSLRRARAAGLRIACGSDGGVYGHDSLLELELLIAAGMSPLEAIRAATTQAAECLGWASELGRIGPGLQADLLVVQGDPSLDPGVLRDRGRVRVMQAGRFIDEEDAIARGQRRPRTAPGGRASSGR